MTSISSSSSSSLPTTNITTTTPLRPRMRWRLLHVGSHAAVAVLFLAIYIPLQGLLIKGWHEAFRGAIVVTSLMIGFWTPLQFSLDARMERLIHDDGFGSTVCTTQGTVTNRKTVQGSWWWWCPKRHFIQYTYTAGNHTYANDRAWFRHLPGNEEEESAMVVPVFYLRHEPHVSLPCRVVIFSNGTIMRPYRSAVPSAGSASGITGTANNNPWTYNQVLLMVLLVTCNLTGVRLVGHYLMHHDNDNDDDESLWQTLWGHALGVVTACTLYYVAWMQPRERRQRFSVVFNDHNDNNDDDHDSKTSEEEEEDESSSSAGMTPP